MTADNQKLHGKRLLIVDDEQDVLDSLIELLDMCKIDTATSFESGRELLETREYDAAVLDIMGVQGFDLLEIATNRNIPVLMLTANALSEESLKKSVRDGAAFFVPKERMIDIEMYVTDVLEALEAKKSPWEVWFERLCDFYDKRFSGTDWREKEKEFWQNKIRKKF